jgi:hypothetical protein
MLTSFENFWAVVSTLDAFVVEETLNPSKPSKPSKPPNRSGSGRLIQWITLPTPSLSEVMQIEALAKLEQKLPVASQPQDEFTRDDFWRLVEYCGGHFRTLEELYKMVNDAIPENLTIALPTLMSRLNIKSYHKHLQLPYIAAALRNKRLRLNERIPGTNDLFRSLIQDGTYVNTIDSVGTQDVTTVPQVPRLSVARLYAWAEGKLREKLGGVNLDRKLLTLGDVVLSSYFSLLKTVFLRFFSNSHQNGPRTPQRRFEE